MARKKPRTKFYRKISTAPRTTGLYQDGAYPPSKRQTEDAWSFLDLPGEVQNAIYLAVLSGSGGAVLTDKLRLAMPAGLSLVSRQVRSQMCGQAMYCVRAHVTDFDFSKVITFLNRLSTADARLLKPKGQSGRSDDEGCRQARLVVHLRFNFLCFEDRARNLARWLNRFNKANKRASDIAFEYVGQCSNISVHRSLQSRLDTWDISFQTDKKRQHMRQIRDALMLNWQKEWAAVTSRFRQPVASCPARRCRCKQCILRHWSGYRPFQRYQLGTDWIEVQDLQA